MTDGEEISVFFKSIWTYVKGLYFNLWKEPYIIYQILSNADIVEIKNHLASFFVNNFYENITSSSSVDYNLLYIFTLLLKNEINGKKAIDPSSFLYNTPMDFLLQQLIDKRDIKSFCKLIIQPVIETLETKSKSLILDVDKLKAIFDKSQGNNIKRVKSNEIFKSSKKNKSPPDDNQIDLALINDIQNEQQMQQREKEEKAQLFMTNYMVTLSLKKKIKEYQQSQNSNMEEYIKYQIDFNNGKNDEDKLFSNDTFIDNLIQCKFSQDILSIYLMSFLKIQNSISILIKNLVEKSHLIPYSIKCLFKIISTLLKNKFPKIYKIEKNAFLSRFFFDKILLPIFEDPTLGALINEYIISGETNNNLKIISEIISKLCSGKLYTPNDYNGSYSPFNLFFIEIMPELFRFFEDI